MPGDFLHTLIAAAVAATMESPAAVVALERRLRLQWGGERPYIRKAPAECNATHRAAEILRRRGE